ncbi:MAG: hypothetical protein RI897_1286 [Verrucomicrobiota bacterium]|jgi:glycosyltransferase involved in cell wall biosynthesis
MYAGPYGRTPRIALPISNIVISPRLLNNSGPFVMFSIITPSFRQLEWLKLCAASIADQTGVEHEHIVQDAGTGAPLEEWAAQQSQLKLFVEKDSGMYDAVNRGLKRSQGDLCAYLNCDEQYLPGTLARVKAVFDARPELEVLFGDAHVVDPKGHYICTRRALLPTLNHSLVSGNLAILTCATFFRRRLLDQHKLFFSTDWRIAGDAVWIHDMLSRQISMSLCNFATSTFTDTGENLALHPEALNELHRRIAIAPVWARHFRPGITLWFRMRKLLHGHYLPRRLSYSIFTHYSPNQRITFDVPRSTGVWKTRLSLPPDPPSARD